MCILSLSPPASRFLQAATGTRQGLGIHLASCHVIAIDPKVVRESRADQTVLQARLLRRGGHSNPLSHRGGHEARDETSHLRGFGSYG